MSLLYLFRILVCTFSLFVPSLLFADDKEQDYAQPLEEVFQAESVYPQEKGEIQLQVSPVFKKEAKREIIQTSIAIEYGITDFWQFEVAWDAHVSRNPTSGPTTRGVGDFEIGTKYSFMNIMESDFHAAIGIEIEFPTGDINKELTEGFQVYEPFLILAKDFPEMNNIQLFSQVSIGFLDRTKNHLDLDDDEPEAHEFTWHAGVFIPWEKFVFTHEFTWETNEWNHEGDENKLIYTPGLVWNLPDAWELGFAVPIGLNNKTNDYEIITQLVYEFDL